MNWRRWIFRGANGLLAPTFLLFSVIQWNDPDPLGWVAIYLATAVACGLELLGRLKWPFPALVALAAAIWAVTIAPRVIGHVDWGHAFASMGSMSGDPREEEARELVGLAIVAVWNVVLTVGAVLRERAMAKFRATKPG